MNGRRTAHFVARLFCVLLITAALSEAQNPTWDVSKSKEVGRPLNSLPASDRAEIAKQVHAKVSDLRAERIETSSGHFFVVQGYGSYFCGAPGNCSFWVLTADYKVVLNGNARTYQIQASSHSNLPDIVTSVQDSALEASLTSWQFNGRNYEPKACADELFGESVSGKAYPHPRITPQPCGKLFGQ